MSWQTSILSIVALSAALVGCAPDESPAPTSSSVPASSSTAEESAAPASERPEAITPSPRTKEYEWMTIERWNTMHREDVEIASTGNVDVLFIGDSITEGWPQNVWEEYFGDYKAVNFGIGGDKTENLLWRLNNGSVGRLDPQVVVLLIGINNFGLSNHEPDDVAQGVTAVVRTLKGAFPNAEILLNGIFPTKQSAEDPMRDKVAQVNEQIAQLEDDRVHYLYIGDQLVEENGDISAEIMPDYLHLSEKGYRIWAENLQPILADWLEE
ncbi:GDSL-type esterase/lipase family protein [Marinimicrobium agarilyticum]|uniref:GDSL-type esterase/lipase family protein n=1 Tax=Marinimicrobium agarilyticum TaxID=306546 RepID=UPI00040A218E|nr:GDSL-type esterase/lipase family protein [Marinimicrobium agarilyticum]